MHKTDFKTPQTDLPILEQHKGTEPSFKPCPDCIKGLSALLSEVILTDTPDRFTYHNFPICPACSLKAEQMLEKYGGVIYSGCGIQVEALKSSPEFPRKAAPEDPKCPDCVFGMFSVPIPGFGAVTLQEGSRGVCCREEMKITVDREETCDNHRPKK